MVVYKITAKLMYWEPAQPHHSGTSLLNNTLIKTALFGMLISMALFS